MEIKQTPKERSYRLKSPSQLLESDIRFTIYCLLHVYPEISLSELSQRLNKTKSTIHPHLQKLLNIGLIEVSKEVKVRANIKAKYYSLRAGYKEEMEDYLLETCHDLDETTVQNKINLNKSCVVFLKSIYERYLSYLEELENNDKAHEILQQSCDNYDMIHVFSFFSKKSLQKIIKLYEDFLTKFIEIEEEDVKENLTEEKPYLVLFELLNLKKIVKF